MNINDSNNEILQLEVQTANYYAMRGWLSRAPKTRGTLKLEVDVDPQSFL